MLDGTRQIGNKQLPPGVGSAAVPYQIPFSLPAGDPGTHTIVMSCGQPSYTPPVTYPFTLITERITVTPTSTQIGATVTVSATGVVCESRSEGGPGSILIEWADAPTGTDVLLTTIPAGKAYEPVLPVKVTVPANAQKASTVSLRCDFDPSRSQRATAAVQVASPYSLVLSPQSQTVGGHETVTVKGLNCAVGSNPATAVVLVDGAKVADFAAPDAGAHSVSFRVDKQGTHQVGVRCSWQAAVLAELTGTFTAGPPPVVQTLKPSSGPVGTDFGYTVSGVTCPTGIPLQLVWDGKLVLDTVADASNITKVHTFSPNKEKVPQAADGNHTLGVRCGDNGQPVAELQAFTVTSQPNLAVDPPRGQPDDAISARQTGFNCTNAAPGYNNGVIYLFDNVRLTQLTVPHTTKAGKHVLVAQCDWPLVDDAHQRSKTFWVPGITVADTHRTPEEPVTVNLAGFDCPTATVYFGASPVTNVAITPDGVGTTTLTPPADLTPGSVTVGANCPNSTVRPTTTYQLEAVAVTAPSVWPELLAAILALLAVAGVGYYLIRRGRGPRGPRGRPPGLHIELVVGLPRLQVRERR